MGCVKAALMTIHEAGCLWLDDGVIVRLREAGHAPQTRRMVVEGHDAPIELDVLPAAEGFRLLPLAAGEDREEIADALAEYL